jgi:P4 family phage/plasmid primase-like protien
MSTAGASFDPQQVRQWLDLLHSQATGLTHVCATGDWAGRVFDDLDAATEYAARLDAEHREGIYARITTLRAALEPGRRGGASDTAALPALWADLDLAGPGHAEHDLPPTVDAGQQIITISGLPTPTLWVHSGGGLYPIWLLDQPAIIDETGLDAAKALSAGWQRVIEHAAAQLGWRYGRGVGDLARVLRIPGTINRKEGLARPCRILTSGGQRYPLGELQAALDTALTAITPPPAAATLLPGSAPAPARERSESDPGEDFNRRADWSSILEPAGWTRHNTVDGVDQWTRPGKPSGISATTNAMGTDRLHVFSTNAAPFTGGESYHKFAAYTLLHHGGDYRAAARELGSRGYGQPLDHGAQQRADLDIILPGWRDTTPPPTIQAAPGGPPSRYFADGGSSLLAQVLTRDVVALGPLAVGGDDIMWSYQDGVWSANRHVVRNRLTRLLGDRYRRAYANHIEDMVRAECPIIYCDPIPELINFRNGLLDWRTGTLHPHSPEVLSTVQLSVEWTPEASCPRFDAFLAEVVPADVVPVVWELIGYLMLSGNPLHKAIMLMGTGRNGKGTLLRAIVALLGVRNVTAASLHDLTSTRFTTATLYGKLANIAGDIDATYLESTAIFKAITGQDQISAEHKGRDRFEFTPWAVPVFSANEIPPSADTSTGYLSRWLPIPFPNSFVGREDRDLDAKLAAELPGIAAKAIPALRVLMARGEFARPASVTAALDEFARRVDQVRSWLADCCEPIPPQPHDPASHPFVPRTTIYEAYRRWCNRDGHRAMAASKFYDRLGGAGATSVMVRGQRGFRGVTITDGAAPTTQSQSGHWWSTSSDESAPGGAGGEQVGSRVHNANLLPLINRDDQPQQSYPQAQGAEGAAFRFPTHGEVDHKEGGHRNSGDREKLLPLLPPAPLITCRACGKPLDPVLAPQWQRQHLHPSCAAGAAS